MTRQEELRERQDQLNDKSALLRELCPLWHWPCAGGALCPVLADSHSASLQNYVHEQLFVRGHQRILLFPGCVLKAALPFRTGGAASLASTSHVFNATAQA